jgi:hypothetical protein
LAAVLSAIGCFYVLTLRAGHTWGDDFAMYLLHARNLAEGRPYAATGYVYNPAEPHLGPPVYPPVFPLLLAPLYQAAGLNLYVFKILEVVVFLLFLAASYTILAPYMPPGWRLAAMVLIGLNPSLWEFKDAILSDVPAALFAFCAVWLVQSGHSARKSSIQRAALTGFVMYLAAGTRNTALVLVPALFLFDLMRVRRITRFSVVAASVCGMGLLMQQQLIDAGAGYSGLFRLEPGWIATNAFHYVRALRTFWLNGYSHPLSYAVFTVSLLLAAWGFWKTGRRQVGYLEIYLFLHLLLLFVYSAPGLYRYLLPVLPLYVAFTLAGLRDLVQRSSPTMRRALVTYSTAAAVLSYAGVYSRANWTLIREGVGDPDFVVMAAHIRDHTPPGSVIAFLKPRVLSLLSHRPAATYTQHAAPDQVGAFLREFNVQYVLATRLRHPDFAPDAETLWPYLDRAGPAVEKVFAAGPYTLFRVSALP